MPICKHHEMTSTTRLKLAVGSRSHQTIPHGQSYLVGRYYTCILHAYYS